ncbi:thioredoxin family protein [Cellulomonas sp. URHD0024]|uniref:thioredoxin family protein n=1 Tax=Cellulomonas sp. URHD0024 TaxID=1302620 RepID=UPI000480C13B|nr:thioredoxin family protein [Cellulomonas sp. URHD0024]
MGNVLLVAALLAVSTGLGLWWRARNGRYTPVDAQLLRRAVDEPDVGDHQRLTAAELGVPLGRRATFAQFSSEVCTPCRRTAAVLGQLVTEHDDLSHVEMDVVEHLDLVRRFSIMRTPTILLLDARGVVVGRMSGATDRRHALAALEACPGGVTAP